MSINPTDAPGNIFRDSDKYALPDLTSVTIEN